MTMLEFFKDDYPRSLFPMETNAYLIENGGDEIRSFLEKCLDPDDEAHSFLAQTRVYAAKPQLHLRRTVKLDFVAEYFIYDLIYRERSRFRKPHREDRRHFGYRFENGQPIAPSASFRGFRGAIAANEVDYKHSLSFDVASYFNSIYHHDLVSWMANTQADDAAYNSLGQFLREINSGRSVDCLPQGLYPTKMIGNDFLRFIEEHHALKSSVVIRFMDDIYLFSNNENHLQHDFVLIQKLLGEKGLSVNPNKTVHDTSELTKIAGQIDDVKASLLKKRRVLITTGYDENDNEIKSVLKLRQNLSPDELKYLTDLLSQDHLDEEDAELILTIMRENTKVVHDKLPVIAASFPHLAKNIHAFCGHVADHEFVADMVRMILEERSDVHEYQLFWFASMLQSYLMETSRAAELIDRLFHHPNAGMISQAKVLEIPDTRFGLTELRDSYLGAGRSDWLSWSAAVGHRNLRPISRNHRLTYFAKASPINALIFRIVSRA